jgi:hypothetical protein
MMATAVALLALSILAAGAAAQTAPADTSVANEPAVEATSPVSFWGGIPAPADSTTAAFDNRSRAAWEWVLIVPYSVINIPLRYLRLGFGAGVRWVDRHNFFKYIHFTAVPKGFVPSVGYSSQEGLLLGLDYYSNFAGHNNPFRIRGQYSTNQWQRYTAGILFNRGGLYMGQTGLGYRERPNLEYFGLGPNTEPEDRSFYSEERKWVGVGGRRGVGRGVVALIVTYSAVEAALPPSEYSPTVLEQFPEIADRPGFDADSKGVMGRLGFGINTTHRESNPDRGTFAAASVGIFDSTNQDDVSFLAYRFEYQKFLSVWGAGRSLAIRTYLNWLDNTGGLPIPFQRLFINEYPDQFRGYDKGRWRDRGITGLTAEYRFPFLHDRLDGGVGLDWVAFTDIGQVFDEFDAIAASNLTYSYGFGVRLFSSAQYAGSIEFAWSEEGFQFRLATKQVFQFTRDVLFMGHEEALIH